MGIASSIYNRASQFFTSCSIHIVVILWNKSILQGFCVVFFTLELHYIMSDHMSACGTPIL